MGEQRDGEDLGEFLFEHKVTRTQGAAVLIIGCVALVVAMAVSTQLKPNTAGVLRGLGGVLSGVLIIAGLITFVATDSGTYRVHAKGIDADTRRRGRRQIRFD